MNLRILQKDLNKYRILSWIPAICVMTGIFCFSSQSAVESSKLSGGMVEQLFVVLEKFFQLQFPAGDRILWLELFETILRKAAHMSEYAVLAITVAFPVYIYSKGKGKFIAWSESICVAYAMTDEFHQLFVPGRSGQITDVIIDGTGALIGLGLLMLLMKTKKRGQTK